MNQPTQINKPRLVKAIHWRKTYQVWKNIRFAVMYGALNGFGEEEHEKFLLFRLRWYELYNSLTDEEKKILSSEPL